MDEFSLIDDLIAPGAGARDDVLLGIGDDGAIVRPPPGEDLVMVADTLVEGVHFPPQLPPSDLGYRAIAVNLSDLAAMGATPRWALLALTLPAARRDFILELVRGMREALAAAGVQLVGGDTTRGPLCLTVQMTGSIPPALALTRAGARAGDRIFVSGTLGDAAAGLAVLRRGVPRDPDAAQLLARFARPLARNALGIALRSIASACIDVSDGLVGDLAHVARRSGCTAVLDLAALPLSDALVATVGREEAGRLALTGGDDYELCFTVPPAQLAVLAGLDQSVRLTAIGTVEDGNAGTVVLQDESGVRRQPTVSGYRHFV